MTEFSKNAEIYIPVTHTTWDNLFNGYDKNAQFSLSSGRVQALEDLALGIITLVGLPLSIVYGGICEPIKRGNNGKCWIALDITLEILSIPLVILAYIIKGLVGIIHPGLVYKMEENYLRKNYERNVCGMLKMFVAPAYTI